MSGPAKQLDWTNHGNFHSLLLPHSLLQRPNTCRWFYSCHHGNMTHNHHHSTKWLHQLEVLNLYGNQPQLQFAAHWAPLAPIIPSPRSVSSTLTNWISWSWRTISRATNSWCSWCRTSRRICLSWSSCWSAIIHRFAPVPQSLYLLKKRLLVLVLLVVLYKLLLCCCFFRSLVLLLWANNEFFSPSNSCSFSAARFNWAAFNSACLVDNVFASFSSVCWFAITVFIASLLAICFSKLLFYLAFVALTFYCLLKHIAVTRNGFCDMILNLQLYWYNFSRKLLFGHYVLD